jgi:hypothetical protein
VGVARFAQSLSIALSDALETAMLTWKFGLVLGLFVALVALLMWAFGLAYSDASAVGESRFYILAIPAVAVIGGGMVSWNPQMAGVLFVLAAALVLFVFGMGFLPLLL